MELIQLPHQSNKADGRRVVLKRVYIFLWFYASIADHLKVSLTAVTVEAGTTLFNLPAGKRTQYESSAIIMVEATNVLDLDGKVMDDDMRVKP